MRPYAGGVMGYLRHLVLNFIIGWEDVEKYKPSRYIYYQIML